MRGHVRKRGKKWACIVYIGIDDQGKDKYKWFSGYNTKREAEAALPKHIEDVGTGAYINRTSETIREYIMSWLEDKRHQVRPGTFRSYQWLVTKHIVPNVQNVSVAKLQPRHLQKLYNTLQDADPPISNRSILHAHQIIKQALDRAVKWGLVTRNVADAVDPPKPKNVEMKTWTMDELSRFMEEANSSRYYACFILAVSTGMRLGEVLALRWEDVDLDSGVLRVRRTYSYTGKGYQLEEPKTEKGKRTIALPESTVAFLRQHKTRLAEDRLLAGELWEANDLVVCTGLGRPVLQGNIRTLFQRASERANVPRIRIHDLRHLHATMLLKEGVHPKVVQERLGHADIQTTMNIYSHVIPGIQEEAASRVNNLLTKALKKQS